MKIDTHSLYSTVSHEHLDWIPPAANPRGHVGLMAVECGDGRWFLEVEFEGDGQDEWKDATEICDPYAEPFRPPTFLATWEDAVRLADRLYHNHLGRPVGDVLGQHGVL